MISVSINIAHYKNHYVTVLIIYVRGFFLIRDRSSGKAKSTVLTGFVFISETCFFRHENMVSGVEAVDIAVYGCIYCLLYIEIPHPAVRF